MISPQERKTIYLELIKILEKFEYSPRETVMYIKGLVNGIEISEKTIEKSKGKGNEL